MIKSFVSLFVYGILACLIGLNILSQVFMILAVAFLFISLVIAFNKDAQYIK